jgi:hypothetical protein
VPSSFAEFKETADSIIAERGSVFFAIITATVSEKKTFRPVYVEAYWSERSKKWLPRYLGFGQYGDEVRVYCF